MPLIDDSSAGYIEPATPSKAFFDTALGRGCASVLVLGGYAGTIAGVSIGNPLLAGSSFLLITNTLLRTGLRTGAPSGNARNIYFPIISLAAAGLFAGQLDALVI